VNRRLVARATLALLASATAGCGMVAGDTLTDAQQVIAAMRLGSSELTVSGTFDRDNRRYLIGEPIAISVEVNKPAYVAILRVLPSGATTLVFPNRRQPNAQLAADTRLVIADAGGPVDKPGVVLFEFIASDRAGPWLFTRQPAGSADFADLGATTRALAKDIAVPLKVGQGHETAAAHATVRIDDR
jgi:hypothetical protein